MKAKIAVTIEAELLEKIDKMADEFDVNRSQFIENVLSVGLSDAQLLKRLGFVDVAKLVIKLKDKLDKRLSKYRTA
jgi:metal-responsive CopG/Arc/MetJ family transcriptional regulator